MRRTGSLKSNHLEISPLTHFKSMFHFYTPWKQKTRGFLMISGGIKVEHWLKMG